MSILSTADLALLTGVRHNTLVTTIEALIHGGKMSEREKSVVKSDFYGSRQKIGYILTGAEFVALACRVNMPIGIYFLDPKLAEFSRKEWLEKIDDARTSHGLRPLDEIKNNDKRVTRHIGKFDAEIEDVFGFGAGSDLDLGDGLEVGLGGIEND